MKIIVCVKVVPDTASRLKVADDGKQIVQTDLTWIISPYDEYAIEEGLKQVGVETFNKGRVAKLIMSDLAGKKLAELGADTEKKFVRVVEAVNTIMSKWKASKEL